MHAVRPGLLPDIQDHEKTRLKSETPCSPFVLRQQHREAHHAANAPLRGAISTTGASHSLVAFLMERSSAVLATRSRCHQPLQDPHQQAPAAYAEMLFQERSSLRGTRAESLRSVRECTPLYGNSARLELERRAWHGLGMGLCVGWSSCPRCGSARPGGMDGLMARMRSDCHALWSRRIHRAFRGSPPETGPQSFVGFQLSNARETGCCLVQGGLRIVGREIFVGARLGCARGSSRMLTS